MNRYFLFGEEPCREFADTGCVVDCEEYNLFTFTEDMDITELLDAFNGCCDYVELNEQEFEKINSKKINY